MADQRRMNQILVQYNSSQKRIRRQYYHPRVARVNSANPVVNPPTVTLPDEVIDHVFAFLPIKKGTQISTISKRFKKSWLYSRKLIFDREFARFRTRADFISIVSRVFDLHEGPFIESFRLYFDPTGVEPVVDSWVKKTVEKGVEELDLDFYSAHETFKISSEILDIMSLQVLKLCYCDFELEPELTGLKFLKTLILRRTNVSSLTFESLFSNCLLLETMDLAHCYVVSHLKVYARRLRKFKVLKIGGCLDLDRVDIDSPTLVSFQYTGNLCVIRVGDVCRLKDVMINFSPSRKSFTQHFKLGNLALEFPHIYYLTTTSTFIEALCSRMVDGMITDLQYCFWNLKELQLFMEGASYCNLYDIASFLKNCPSIQRVFIDLNEFYFECGLYWDLHQKHLIDHYPLIFYHIRFIKLKGFKFQKHEIEMVKFFLRKSVFLESLVLVTPRDTRIKVFSPDLIAYEQLFSCWKASPRAKIVVYEHYNDMSAFNPVHLKSWY